ncbi:MAG: N-acetylmuramoyl-L-alanine amidase [Verrucomicrobiota bacterium]
MPRLLAAAGLLALASLPVTAEARLSPMEKEPDWSRLDVFQKTMTRSEFKLLVDEVYAPDGVFWRYAKLGQNSVTVYSTSAKKRKLWTLEFAPDDRQRQKPPLQFAPDRKIGAEGKPLAGMTICLDPGHIGGDWAKIEERFFQIGDDRPIIEAELNLITCRYLKQKLEALGAKVVMTKDDYEPVTSQRPDDLMDEAQEAYRIWNRRSSGSISARRAARIARGLFYRNAEIKARAALIDKWKPDLTICVHYNASAWGDPGRPRLTGKSRLVNFVHGAYSARELEYDDQKFYMLRNVLDRIYPHEVAAADAIAKQTAAKFRLGPEVYKNWNAVQQVGPNPYVYARNLVANRVFRGPVIFVEGPYMNAKDAYYWMEAGDYEGTKTFNGRKVPNIMKVYADAVAKGIVEYAQGDLFRATKARIESKS